jgi:hypothetical protein
VSALEARNYATQHGARYHETSAITGKGIAELFRDIATHHIAQRRSELPPGKSLFVVLLLAAPMCLRRSLDTRPASVSLEAQQRNANGSKRRKKKEGGGCCD